jgi:two-component system sensor histidine kinase PhoQ
MEKVGSAPSYSLQNRLLYSFSILLFIFLGLTGLVLDSAFQSSIEAGAANRLQGQIYLLLAAAEEQDGEFYFLEDLQEPRFGQLNSGLYGFISAARGELWRSDSAATLQLGNMEFFNQKVEVGNTAFSTVQGDAGIGQRGGRAEQGKDFFVLSYGILWEDGLSEYKFSVVEDVTPYYSEISNFRASLWGWLGGVAVLLLCIQFFLLRIEEGEADQLVGEFPVELAGVTTNLNLLIETERKQQERYRTTLADLAHSLKTPLAVVVGIVDSFTSDCPKKISSQLASVSEQAERMDQIVSYQLQRAVQSHNSSALAKQINVAKVASKIIRALKKVYSDKGSDTQLLLDPEAIFSGDERDLMEVLGNVLDNSFKYGKSLVLLSVRTREGETKGVEIIIEDDGDGIADDQQEFVLQRGARIDTLKQGQGIGLAVVMDIVKSYNGEMLISRSQDLGGAKITLRFGPQMAAPTRNAELKLS